METDLPLRTSRLADKPVIRYGSRKLRIGPSLLKQLCQCIVALGLGLGSYYLISNYFVQSVQVVGSSMNPTLHDSEFCLLNRWIYYVRQPHRTDVVVIRDPSARCYSVKRIVGVGGDSIYLKNGEVFLNGRKLVEPYLSPHTPTYAYAPFRDQLIVCGKDQYFLLGDNRMNSADSRTYGTVSRQNILGMLVH